MGPILLPLKQPNGHSLPVRSIYNFAKLKSKSLMYDYNYYSWRTLTPSSLLFGRRGCGLFILGSNISFRRGENTITDRCLWQGGEKVSKHIALLEAHLQTRRNWGVLEGLYTLHTSSGGGQRLHLHGRRGHQASCSTNIKSLKKV